MKEMDCQVFEDQLEGLVQGALPEDGVRLLRAHAVSCRECATLPAWKSSAEGQTGRATFI